MFIVNLSLYAFHAPAISFTLSRWPSAGVRIFPFAPHILHKTYVFKWFSMFSDSILTYKKGHVLVSHNLYIHIVQRLVDDDDDRFRFQFQYNRSRISGGHATNRCDRSATNFAERKLNLID